MMGISLSKEKLLELTKGKSPDSPGHEKVCATGLQYSSKDVQGGEIFVALKGENTHGHAYVNDAYTRGASLILVEDDGLLNGFPEPHRLVVVKDTSVAFNAVTRWWRHELGAPFLAITGSVGKTTAKEIAASILLKTGAGNYSLKSFNNQVGVPYTICRTKRDHCWSILEMGMNHPGEIRELSRLAEPDAAAITKIAPAHIMSFGDIEGIARAKLEVLDGMKPSAPLILNGDDEVLRTVYSKIEPNPTRPVVYFGSAQDCQARVSGITTFGFDGIGFRLSLCGEDMAVKMAAMGRQTAMNAACAALAAKMLCPALALEQVKSGLESFTAPLMRLNLRPLTEGRKLVDDCYNANPASMAAFMELAHDLKTGAKRGVGVVVGDMRELGSFSEKYHREIGQSIALARPAFVIAVGDYAGLLLEEASKAGIRTWRAESPEEAGRIVLEESFDIVMFKASRGIALERGVNVVMSKIGAEDRRD